MTAKEYLNQAYWLDRRIDSKLMLLENLKDMATKTTSIMSDEVVSHTRNVHRMQDIIAKIADMEDEINADIDALVDLKREIGACIRDVANPEYQILLEQRYQCFQSWGQIADSMGYSINNIYRMHSKALEEVRVPKVESSEQ